MGLFVGRDDLHYTFRAIDGYNKAYNFVVSSRDPGKTTAKNLDKMYLPWVRDHKPSIVLRRLSVDITDLFISDLAVGINKFLATPIELGYKRSSTKDGAVDIFAEDAEGEKRLFARVIALSVPVGRIKSLIVRNPSCMIMDEFIVNPRFGEKYLPGEATRFKEIYNTFERESSTTFKAYFLGNPYSMYNPYFSWMRVPVKELHEGVTLTGKNWAVECYQMTDELKASILARNPLYQFDDSYKAYAFDGRAINDAEIPQGSRPDGATLAFTIKLDQRALALYRTLPGSSVIYYAETMELADVSRNRTLWIVDLDDLTRNSLLFSSGDKFRFARFAEAVRSNRMLYKDVESYYLTKEVYCQL